MKRRMGDLVVDGRWSAALAVVGLALAGPGCAGDEGGRGGSMASGPGLTSAGGMDTDGPAGDDDDDSDDDDDDDEADDGGPSEVFDVGSADDGGPMDEPEPEDCAAVTQDADAIKQPADIIFVVDNSGSMNFEAEQIQVKMNGFSQQIIDSGVDARVVLISSYPDDGNGICIDAPLGSGGCPDLDNNAPTFTHVDMEVDSHNAWQRVLQTHGQWGLVTRPEAALHLVVVTDDTSNMPLAEFDPAFKALNPNYLDYVHHSVVCHENCNEAAGIGTNYINLTDLTGGIASDLCDQDFQNVFDTLSTEVISGAQLACEWEIPDPPDGLEFDPEAVNLEFHDGAGGGFEVGKVESMVDCPNVVDGWYYDNPANPQMVVVCPQTCEKIQGFLMGTIDIIFGCDSEPAPPTG